MVRDQAPSPLQAPTDTEEAFERKRAIVLHLTNIAIIAAALESMGNKIRQGDRPSDEVLANRLNGLAMLLTEHVALIDAETTGPRPVWH
ncbi:MAG: hypothetical protein B7Y08_18585 [Rhodospirillales bacterium 24-66-33]|nr:MAG: hypothetical protein B7Y57_17335 [Rhodospirillales bacterium 35-66-84]OYZ93088.1 MAG: hypothetical protein B7Y08_18585 [Rhodospirillales bacterium 24-66-33]OZB24216.1 MAG: hypothetical protein B7X63_16545 [Rhodospirillales bacterium 39-66-50]